MQLLDDSFRPPHRAAHRPARRPAPRRHARAQHRRPAPRLGSLRGDEAETASGSAARRHRTGLGWGRRNTAETRSGVLSAALDDQRSGSTWANPWLMWSRPAHRRPVAARKASRWTLGACNPLSSCWSPDLFGGPLTRFGALLRPDPVVPGRLLRAGITGACLARKAGALPGRAAQMLPEGDLAGVALDHLAQSLGAGVEVAPGGVQ